MVGQLYKPNDSRADAGFSLFMQELISELCWEAILYYNRKRGNLAKVIPEEMRWNVAFGLAAIVMVVSLINFVFTQRSLGTIGLQPGHPLNEVKSAPIPKWQEYGVYVLSLIFVPIIMIMVAKTEYTDYFMWTVGPLTLIYLFYEMTKVTPAERNKLLAALVFILFSILFWGIYEQSGGSLSILPLKI